MFYILNQLGWLAFTVLLIVVVVLYVRINRQIGQLRRDVGKLQIQLRNQRNSNARRSSVQPTDNFISSNNHVIADSAVDTAKLNTTNETNTTVHAWPPSRPTTPQSSLQDNTVSSTSTTGMNETLSVIKSKTPTAAIQPDESSLPIVTSLFHSIKNWFFGGNLVVRVGVLVLLVGVVLLLRLLSDYIEIPIAFKLMTIGVAGLGLAALGLKLTAKRFSYGITLQGAGLAIAYLSTFFAYSVYEIIPSLPSFIGLGILSAITIALAVRQNAFPLALLSLSGGFFAPILTSDDTGSLITLFSYYLLLNVTIAVIAHYRPWKILNLFGVTVTFGLAYYWGISENLTAIIETQRWSLVILVTLHLLLYLFVVIRYAQQIIAYNILNEENSSHTDNANNADNVGKIHSENNGYVFPIDTGLLFSVPILAFGLFAALLDDIPNALTITSAVLAVIYLGLGWLFVQRSQRYALITEGMLALGFGFLALVIPLALDAEWIAFGWSVQGLALVWFGRRSLRAWSVLFGLLLQLISIGMLMIKVVFAVQDYQTLALTISAMAYLTTVFILRASNSPAILNVGLDSNLDSNSNSNLAHSQEQTTTSDSIVTYANALGISTQAAQQWLTSINSQSNVFNLVWRSPLLIRLLTFTAMAWLLQVLLLDFNQWFTSWQLATTTLIAIAALISLSTYWVINRYRSWAEIRQFSHGLLVVFYLMLALQLPQKFEFHLAWQTADWLLFTGLIIGGLVIGQLWLKTWYEHSELSRYDGASWLGAGILVIAAAAHYGLADSAGVMAILIPAILILAGLWFSYRDSGYLQQNTQTHEVSNQGSLYWFDWQQALFKCAAIFAAIALFWVVITNWSYDGVIWELPYFPLLNLYDITSWLALFVGCSLYYMSQHRRDKGRVASNTNVKSKRVFTAENLLIILGLISFWLISSMLVRTLHAFIATPLWTTDAWSSEQVQTGLTILWTLLALVATIIASRYWQRALWFMGIGLLGIVVLKLVLVDLSQTEAIWRVISFLGAGSLILLIGYLAPLPPAHEEIENQN
ncbi:DUF2339 domain-containing protein [Psychrobacter sp. K31L]|uniref:DUF2339 domain-containing protein n=1 Tax=Psychrobacter sp. K31L TaxID=2820758 RepID=UPI001B328BEE|nr:DUF2339 domain-containing protein [Psychrobacter sp. K31L]MBP3946624.1 DUF2339 domain-containing protein [Psychrobacter sp. K31L]